MKANIHPDYHEITVTFTDGTSFKTRSTYGKAGDAIMLDVDPKTHPAWVGGVHMKKTGQMEKFANKFGNIAMAGAIPGNNAATSKKEEKKDEAK